MNLSTANIANTPVNSRLQQLQEAYRNPQSPEQKKLKKAAQDLESVFFRQLLDMMDKTVDRSDSILNGGEGETTFRGMLNEQLANSFASRPGGSGLGLAEIIFRQTAQATVGLNQATQALSQLKAQGSQLNSAAQSGNSTINISH